MANQFKVAVEQTREELQHRHRRATTAHPKERLQMLYSIKTGAVSTSYELAQRIQRDDSTIYRWLKRYKQGGIEALLSVKTAPGKISKITPEALQQLSSTLGATGRIPQLWSDSTVVGNRMWASCGVSNGALI
ncbi:MAG TPA: helix-turn-helix domain-containing protein [Waterburya sp.]|jgi:transposase-like protein